MMTDMSDPEADQGEAKRRYRVGRKFTKYTVQDKATVIELLEQGAKTCDIVRLTGFPESTIRNIKKKMGEIKGCLNTAEQCFSWSASATNRVMQTTSQQNHLLAVTEFSLNKWIQTKIKEQASLSISQIKTQARVLYAEIAREKNITQPRRFIASTGWFNRFKGRYNVACALGHSEMSSADQAAGDTDAKERDEDEDYISDETGIYENEKLADETMVPAPKKIKLVADEDVTVQHASSSSSNETLENDSEEEQSQGVSTENSTNFTAEVVLCDDIVIKEEPVKLEPCDIVDDGDPLHNNKDSQNQSSARVAPTSREEDIVWLMETRDEDNDDTDLKRKITKIKQEKETESHDEDPKTSQEKGVSNGETEGCPQVSNQLPSPRGNSDQEYVPNEEEYGIDSDGAELEEEENMEDLPDDSDVEPREYNFIKQASTCEHGRSEDGWGAFQYPSQFLSPKGSSIQWATVTNDKEDEIIQPIPGRGPSPEMYNIKRPEDFFYAFIDDEMLAIVVKHTNDMIAKLRKKFRKSSLSWLQNISIEELKAFIGLLLYSGARRDNHIPMSELWSTLNGHSIYQAMMTEPRLQFIMRSLRFDDAESLEEKEIDGLTHIRGFWENFMKHCRENYVPGVNITVGEHLYPFKGRCVFRMRNSNAPSKFGFRIIQACDSASFYMFSGIPYMGKDTYTAATGVNQGHSLIVDLLEGYSGRVVTADSWFTSLPLANDLLQHDCKLVGTIVNKPEIPREFREAKGLQPEGTTSFVYRGNIMLVAYKVEENKKPMVIVTTRHRTPSMGERGRAVAWHHYNRTKGGVDMFGRLCSLYTAKRKTKRWVMSFFMAMLDMAAVNAFVISEEIDKAAGRTPKCRRSFLMDVAKGLMQPWSMMRLRISCLNRNLREVIRKLYDVPEDFGLQPGTSKLEKYVRCQDCLIDRRTKTACSRCQKPICRQHEVAICASCSS